MSADKDEQLGDADFDTPTRGTWMDELRNPELRDEAVSKIVDTYYRLVSRIARQLVYRREDAEELTQEAMLNLVKGLPNFEYSRRKGKFRNYLSRVVLHAYLRQYKRIMRERDLFAPGLDAEHVDALLPSEHFAKNVIEDWFRLKELEEIVPVAISRLPQNHQKVYRAIYIEKQEREQLAREMKLKRNSIDKIVERCRNEIREYLRKLDDWSDWQARPTPA